MFCNTTSNKVSSFVQTQVVQVVIAAMILPLSDICDDYQAIIDNDDDYDYDYGNNNEQEISATTTATAPLLIFVSAPTTTKIDIDDVVEEIKEDEGDE